MMRRTGRRRKFELWSCFDDVRTSRRTRLDGSPADHFWAFPCKPRMGNWCGVMVGQNAQLGSAERLAAATNESLVKRGSARRVVRLCMTVSPRALHKARCPHYEGPVTGPVCAAGLLCECRKKSLWGPIKSASRADWVT